MDLNGSSESFERDYGQHDYGQHYRPQNAPVSPRTGNQRGSRRIEIDDEGVTMDCDDADRFILAVFGVGIVAGCLMMWVYHEIAMAIFCVCK